jgi:hypothetical protein
LSCSATLRSSWGLTTRRASGAVPGRPWG